MRASVVVIALACLLCLTSIAAAKRPATPAESRAMWQVVDPSDSCVHRAGRISTVPDRPNKWGRVTVADGMCGDGSYVLRKRAKGPWKIIGAGSDWGERSRCAEDLRRIRRAVLKDLFFPTICSASPRGGGLPLSSDVEVTERRA